MENRNMRGRRTFESSAISRGQFIRTAGIVGGAVSAAGLGFGNVARATPTPRTWIVDNRTGMPHDFTTIQEAWNAANGGDPGDKIQIMPGHYAGASLWATDSNGNDLGKHGITINGSGQTATIIDSPFLTPFWGAGLITSPWWGSDDGGTFFGGKIDNLTISNLKIDGGPPNVNFDPNDMGSLYVISMPIYAFGDCNGWKIFNVTINNSWQAISNWSGSNWNIHDNHISNSTSGIIVNAFSEGGVRGNVSKNNIISGNYIINCNTSIDVENIDVPIEDEGDNFVTNNFISGNSNSGMGYFFGFGPAEWGLLLNSTNITVSGNDLTYMDPTTNISGLTTSISQVGNFGSGGKFSNNKYGPSSFTGILCIGNNNKFTNESFQYVPSYYPGWVVDLSNKMKSSGCMLLDIGTFGNTVNPLQLPTGNVCSQVADLTLHNANPRIISDNSVVGLSACYTPAYFQLVQKIGQTQRYYYLKQNIAAMKAGHKQWIDMLLLCKKSGGKWDGKNWICNCPYGKTYNWDTLQCE